MHVKLTDFGTAKDTSEPATGPSTPSAPNTSSKSPTAGPVSSADKAFEAMGPQAAIASGHTRKRSFVGTAEFCPPEVLQGQEWSAAGDTWSFGCLLVQISTGQVPFHGENAYQSFQRVLARDVNVRYNDMRLDGSDDAPDSPAVDPAVVSLFQSVLESDAKKRPALDTIMSNTFFGELDWRNLRQETSPLLRLLLANEAAAGRRVSEDDFHV